ncbi:hypothetical protein MFAL_03220 [Mycolicibacterium fallax]|nr:hypothetical protein MFAL_03220 [Mycolicibacterium fallax]
MFSTVPEHPVSSAVAVNAVASIVVQRFIAHLSVVHFRRAGSAGRSGSNIYRAARR